MAYVQMKCPSCGADLEIDSDGITKFCPYCGTKLMFDADTLSALLVEREKTAQARERTAQVREIASTEKQRTIQTFISNPKSVEEMTSCIVILGLFLMAFLMFFLMRFL